VTRFSKERDEVTIQFYDSVHKTGIVIDRSATRTDGNATGD